MCDNKDKFGVHFLMEGSHLQNLAQLLINNNLDDPEEEYMWIFKYISDDLQSLTIYDHTKGFGWRQVYHFNEIKDQDC